jgi:hypothetical protein
MDNRSRTLGDWLGVAFVFGTMALVALPGYWLMLAYLLRGDIQPVITLVALVLGGYWAVSLLAERVAAALARRAAGRVREIPDPSPTHHPAQRGTPEGTALSAPGPVVPSFRYRRDLIDRVRHGPPLIGVPPADASRAR